MGVGSSSFVFKWMISCNWSRAESVKNCWEVHCEHRHETILINSMLDTEQKPFD